MKKQVFIYMLVMVCSIFIFGCNKKDGSDLNEGDIIDNSNSIDNNIVENENDTYNNGEFNNYYQIETMAGLINKTDEEVINVLGEGSTVYNQFPDTKSYTREYSHVFEGENVITVISYDNSNKVNGIYTYLPSNDLDKWEQVLTSKLGYPTKLVSISNARSDIQTKMWRLDEAVVTLLGIKNSLSIQIE